MDQSLFCDNNSLGKGNCTLEWCGCIHLLKADPGDIVEIFLVDEGIKFDTQHPMHLHGHGFHVLGMERFGIDPTRRGPYRTNGNSVNIQQIKDLNNAGKIKRNLNNPPLKDTVPVPDAGYTLIRFKANPGYWILHCHMAWHNHLGMGVILKVGDMKKDVSPPPPGFPRCGNYLPPIYPNGQSANIKMISNEKKKIATKLKTVPYLSFINMLQGKE